MDFHYIFLSVLLLPICIGQDPTDFKVQIMPVVSVLNANLNEGKGLTCSSVPPGDLEWFFQDAKITSTTGRVKIETSGNFLRLRIGDVQETDAGVYKCRGSKGDKSDERTINLEVSIPVKVLSKPDQFGIIDQDGAVECDVVGKPVPTLTWKFLNGSDIPNSDKYVISPNRLTIKKLTIEDAQTYNCYVYVLSTGHLEDFLINYEVVKPPVISLLPTFDPPNPKVGDTVVIKCLADGRPNPEYTFFKSDRDKGEVPVSEDKVNKANGILTLTDVQREDEATYRCVASNKGGSDTKSNTLDVLIPPVITDINDVPNAFENTEAKLKCVAEGDPMPDIEWKKLEPLSTGSQAKDIQPQEIKGDMDNLPNAIIKTQSKTLLFSKVVPENAGTYQCTAFNSVGSVSKTAKLGVQYKPHFNTDFKQTEFWGWGGHRANLTCQASANNKAELSWFRPDSEFPDDRSKDKPITSIYPFEGPLPNTVNSDSYLTSSSLLVNIANNDATNDYLYGDYLCKATNSLGDNVLKIQLRKASPPNQPIVKIVDTFSTSVKLGVTTVEQQAGVEVTEYHYALKQNGQAQSEDVVKANSGGETQFSVTNLQPGTSYTIDVQAKSPVGLGSAKSIIVKTPDVSRPEKLTIESPPLGESSNSYTVRWATPVDGGSVITKYIIKYRKCEITEMTTDPKKWTVKQYLANENSVIESTQSSTQEVTIPNLDSDSYYDIRVTAVNDKGESDPESKIIKTSSQTKMSSGAADSASLSSGAIVGIIIGLIVIIAVVAIVVFLVLKKPGLVQGLRGRLGGKAGEEERGKKEDGKDPAEEEKLIKKDDTVKVENELEESKNDVIVEHPEEFEPDSKPEQPDAPPAQKPAALEKPEELKTPTATTEIKITPETPEKPENAAA
ncbi:neural cell adhesion molecule 1-like isoform X3 [Biomphalaria glabrata]|uniref:Neural cell adhesion molecule 1-like isoform X3 n=1 Tax=Biomphalaria glabrata TaxID=6526 RepID=A0A9W2YTJ3_BIOGL|nr:neural cell adhesion molecule 1-like isoform X3 [Biomphalaria glabrata]